MVKTTTLFHTGEQSGAINIIGVVMGIIVCIVLIAVCVIIFKCKRRRLEKMTKVQTIEDQSRTSPKSDPACDSHFTSEDEISTNRRRNFTEFSDDSTVALHPSDAGEDISTHSTEEQPVDEDLRRSLHFDADIH
ncbi:hypothetical protein BaRGS_00023018 [Batillaria attramentaria]|uniref:Uncharacterized protein n=1 Tax=Batillaria attramentaria TaxID=370345 RepID=A0ABD0KFC5_9CAEN